MCLHFRGAEQFMFYNNLYNNNNNSLFTEKNIYLLLKCDFLDNVYRIGVLSTVTKLNFISL